MRPPQPPAQKPTVNKHQPISEPVHAESNNSRHVIIKRPKVPNTSNSSNRFRRWAKGTERNATVSVHVATQTVCHAMTQTDESGCDI